VTQDICSRLTTIVAAYYVGSSLFPEAKAYRFSADIFNDGAITLDAISPLLNSISLPSVLPILGSASGLRVIALCLSGSLRALCGIAAGGSKASLTMHFATPVRGKGDLGDLNAKDASKETVLSLTGMLLGTLIVPYLVTPWSTYTALFLLLLGHLTANYIAVRGVVLRTLNRQRAGIAWSTYRQSGDVTILSPAQVSQKERIFELPGVLRDAHSDKNMGHCTIGSSVRRILCQPISSQILSIFDQERYLLWFDPQNLFSVPGRPGQSLQGYLRLHICLKEGYTALDQLKAWVHAQEVGRTYMLRLTVEDEEEAAAIIRNTYQVVEEHFSSFVDRMRNVGWNTDDGQLLTGSPRGILIFVEKGDQTDGWGYEDKKQL